MRPRFAPGIILSLVLLFAACNALKKTGTKDSAPAKSGSSSSAQLRNRVVTYAQKYVGSAYKYAGTSPSGFDCSGFTSFVLKEFNVKASPASAIQAKEGRSVPLERVQPGDLIFFGESTSHISHVAMVVKRSKDGIVCVHSTTSRGVIVENVSTSTYWKPKILFARDMISRS
jgi:cell wall-associated NlpC family hydrolase